MKGWSKSKHIEPTVLRRGGQVQFDGVFGFLKSWLLSNTQAVMPLIWHVMLKVHQMYYGIVYEKL